MIPNHILQVIFEFEIFCKFGFYRTCHIWHISFTAVMQQTSQLYMVGKSSCFSLFAARDRMLGNRIKETGMTVCTTDQRQGMSDVFHINFFRNRMDGVEMLPRKICNLTHNYRIYSHIFVNLQTFYKVACYLCILIQKKLR